MPSYKITYFPQPGKAEAIRLMAAIAGVQLEDERVDRAGWAPLKEKVAPRQLPLFYIDGELFGQSLAQTRYFAKQVGMYPRDDDLLALRIDEWVDNVNEVFPPIAKSFGIEDPAEKEAFRLKQVSPGGDAHKWLTFLDQQLEGKTFAVGDKLTLADIVTFVGTSPLRAGWLDGIPTTCLDEFKNLAKHRAMMANHEKVKAYYANAEGVQKVFQNN